MSFVALGEQVPCHHLLVKISYTSSHCTTIHSHIILELPSYSPSPAQFLRTIPPTTALRATEVLGKALSKDKELCSLHQNDAILEDLPFESSVIVRSSVSEVWIETI